MANNTLDKAIAAVPKFGDRISLFTKKLRLAQYADGSIYDYRLKIAQAVLFFKKLPEEFTQTDIDYYLSALLEKNRCSLSFFKHTVFGLQAYYKVMGLKQPGGLDHSITIHDLRHSAATHLFYHPHIHCIVPGGGIDKLGVWHHLNVCEDPPLRYSLAIFYYPSRPEVAAVPSQA